MKRQRIFLALGLVGALAAIVGYWLYQRRPRPMEWSGTVEARTVQVASRVGGRVKEVFGATKVLSSSADESARKTATKLLEMGMSKFPLKGRA